MAELITFLKDNGWQLTLIAIAGIIILGILKYANVFKKLDKKIRHILYMAISIALSLIRSVIYLACTHNLELDSFLAFASAVFALNQAAYALYDTLTLKELFNNLLDFIFHNKEEIVEEVKEQIEEDKNKKE